MKIRLFSIPNIITLLNLICGTLAIIAMISEPSVNALPIAFGLMISAAVFDFLDGFAARLLKCPSPLGVQLDSLADMVTFGVLPSIIALKIFYLTGGEGLWGSLTLLIAPFSALRLAKFNIDDSQHEDFEGLPTPANALLIGSFGYFICRYTGDFPVWMPTAVIVCAVVLALLLISPVRMFSLKFRNFGFRGNETRYLFLALAVVFLIVFHFSGICLIITLYILTSVIKWLACPKKRRL